MSFTREQGARTYLHALGNIAPIQQVVDWLTGWSAQEVDPKVCEPSFNLLGIGQEVAGSKHSHCVGTQFHVQDYPSLASAATAFAINLLGPDYVSLRHALQSNDIAALENSQGVKNGLHAWRVGPNSSDWGGYESRTQQFRSIGAQHRGDIFTGEAGNAASPINDCIQQCKSQIGFDFVNCFNACLTAAGSPPQQGPFSAGDNSCGPGGIIPSWICVPDWSRVLKVVLGSSILLIAVILTGYVLVGKVEQAAPVKAAADMVRKAAI